MNLWPFKRKSIDTLQPVTSTTSWWHAVLESFTGAWQQNVIVRRESVLAYWAVYACIKLIAGDIAKMRLKLVEQGENGIWSEITAGSPFLPVLRKPNHFQTRVQFWNYWYTCLLIHGNTYALKQRDNRGVVTALYILDPRGVTVLVAEDGSIFYQLKRDNLSGREELLDVTVPASEIVHDRLLCLYHPLVGVSPIYACGVAATQGLAIQNNSANFFTNGAMPGGILIVPGSLSKEKAAELKEQWNSSYTGENRGKTAVLADKMEYKPLTMTAVDAQTVEQLKMTAEMVCSTFNVPAYKVGVGSPPANANVAALNQQYYDQCLQTIIEGTEIALDEALGLTDVTGKTYGCEFDVDALIRMDPAAQMSFVDTGVKAGVFSPNDGRKRFDLQPVRGGEGPYLQQQNYSLEALAKRDALADPFATTPAPTPAPATPDDPAVDAAAKQMARDLEAAMEITVKWAPPLALPAPTFEIAETA